MSDRDDRVLVVAARKVWTECTTDGLYFCQLSHSFKPSNYLAFYTGGEIKPAVPAITSTVESIELIEEALQIS